VHERYRQTTDRWQTDGRQHIANVNSPFAKNGWTSRDAICVWTLMGWKKHLLHDGAHWCNLANITEPSVCGGDMALCQTTLTTCSGWKARDFEVGLKRDGVWKEVSCLQWRGIKNLNHSGLILYSNNYQFWSPSTLCIVMIWIGNYSTF